MLIAVSGNIGAGKTTLVQRLSTRLGYQAEYEAVHENPYLQRFYDDMQRWSFPLQVYFLSHRFRQGLGLKNYQRVVIDRTIYEDAHIFARNLYDSGYMSETDYHTYLNLYENMVPLVPQPSLMVYLKGSPGKLAERIAGRSKTGERAYEGNIPLAYLSDLNKRYESWIQNEYNHSPVIQLDVEETDLNDEASFEKLVETVQSFKNA
jgi:deoxyadenosine/deoxycytidine kinase